MPRLILPTPGFQTAEGYAPPEFDPGPFARIAAGEIGGLTQFGVQIETLPPGSASSMRHWHSLEDEFVLILDGTLTLIEDGGETPLGPGEAAAFPAGRPNGHHLVNRSDAHASFLVAGSRDPADICFYSGQDRMSQAGKVTRRDGTPLDRRDASVPPFVDPPWPGPSARIDIPSLPTFTGSSYPEPHAALVARRSFQRLGRAGGLSRFGVNLVTIQPGDISSLRHWHSDEDEFLIVREGVFALIEDEGETVMGPGDMAAFPAGRPDGHHMRNDGHAPARFLVIGTSAGHGTCHYPDVDLVAWEEPGRAWYARRDGTVLKEM